MMGNAVHQHKGQPDQGYPNIPHKYYTKMSSYQTQCYKDIFIKPRPSVGHQYPNLKKANNVAKIDHKPGAISNNGHIWQPGGPPRKVNMFHTLQRLNSSITNPVPVIESDPKQPTNAVFYEEHSSDDESVYTPSTIDVDSEVWFQEDQDSIATKLDDDGGTIPIVHQHTDPSELSGSNADTRSTTSLHNSESMQIQNCIITCDAIMIDGIPAEANPAGIFSNPVAGLKQETPRHIYHYPWKLPRIWVSPNVTQDDDQDDLWGGF
jgi:hypothetical protein